MLYTRRDMGKVALAALPLARAIGAPKINSKVDGVQLGAITYSFGGMNLEDVGKVAARAPVRRAVDRDADRVDRDGVPRRGLPVRR